MPPRPFHKAKAKHVTVPFVYFDHASVARRDCTISCQQLSILMLKLSISIATASANDQITSSQIWSQWRPMQMPRM
jgi:hypothetical protein